MNACTNEYPHKTGEYVSYKNNGICKIVDIVTKEFAGMDSKTYYELQMVFDQGNVLYIPVDAENLVQEMRHVLSAQEIEDVIVQSEQYQDMWIDDGKARAAQYEEILAEGDRRIKGISLARNFGQHAALMAGFRHVDGDIVVCLDDDGQTPADEVDRLLDKLEEGFDAV